MIKVLFLINTLGGGGAERVLVNLVNHMDRTKFDITVKTMFKGGVNEKRLDPAIRYECCKAPMFRGYAQAYRLVPSKALYRRFVGKEHYDVIVAYMHGAPTKVISGCSDETTKTVTWLHTGDPKNSTLFKFWLRKKDAFAAYGGLGAVVGISKTVRDAFSAYTGIAHNLELVYNTNDTARIFEQAKEEAALPFEKTRPLVCSVGRAVHVKGYDRLIRAAVKLHSEGVDFDLAIIGDGECFKALKKQVAESNAEEYIHLLGFRDNPYPVMQAADVFVCSSRQEGLSTVVAESMILGTPVVSTDVSGAREMLGDHDEYGVVVANSGDGVYEGLRRILTEPGLLLHYREKVKERAPFFSTEHTVSQVQDLLERLVCDENVSASRETARTNKGAKAILSSLYKRIERSVIAVPATIKRIKLVLSEKQAIKRKKPLYQKVVWSASQQQDMNTFWKTHYGRAITPRWHKLYESMNGTYQKAYFPEMLYTTELEPVLNPEEYCRFFNDKSIIEFLYGGVEGVRLPKTLMTSCNGMLCNAQRELMDFESACAYLENIGDCVIKPTVETGSGHGVAVLCLQDGKDRRTGKTVGPILKEHGKDYIVQERLANSAEFATIYPYAVNTIRLITYIVGEEIHHMPLVMRIGVGGHEIDNIHAGGLCIGVNEDGTLKKRAYQLGYGDTAITYEKHPDTGIVFDGYYIGDVKNLIDIAKRLHRRTPHMGIFSWDFTFDRDGIPVMIEANCKDQSIWFPQIVNECAAFGDDTPYMLRKIYGRRKL